MKENRDLRFDGTWRASVFLP